MPLGRSSQLKQKSFELDGTHELLVYTDDVGSLNGNVKTNKNHKHFREVNLEVSE
jgi:hypothetical protein